MCRTQAPEQEAEQGAQEWLRASHIGEITQILEQARANLSSEAGVINLLKEIGSPSGVIVNRVEDYDLTVIGPKGRRASGEVGLGPVASRGVEHAMVPVSIVRELRSEEGVRILAAVDGSAASLHAIETLRTLFDLTSTEVCLIACFPLSFLIENASARLLSCAPAFCAEVFPIKASDFTAKWCWVYPAALRAV